MPPLFYELSDRLADHVRRPRGRNDVAVWHRGRTLARLVPECQAERLSAPTYKRMRVFPIPLGPPVVDNPCTVGRSPHHLMEIRSC